MKNLKLKMKDLTNPTILTHHEIKNIMGGIGDSGSGHLCTLEFYDGQTITQNCTSEQEMDMWMKACAEDSTCASAYCD